MAGVLAAIAIVLGITRIGFIPVPTAAGNATIMHVPAIIGGIMEGWIVGGMIGAIFGIYSFINATVPMFKDPLVAIIPRIFIGITAYAIYAVIKKWQHSAAEVVAAGAAAAVGTLTNTILVLGMAVIRGYMPPGVAVTVGIVHGLPEVIVAVIVVEAVVLAWKFISFGRQTADL